MSRDGAASVTIPCPGCGKNLGVDTRGAGGAVTCARCGEKVTLAGGPPIVATAPASCLACGSPFLYWQKDFDQRIGCLLIAIGAALTPWTYGLSLAVLALLDWILYRALPRISVCYVCKARYRGVPPHPDHKPFDLMTAQTYEARAKNWADGKTRPAAPQDPAAPADPQSG